MKPLYRRGELLLAIVLLGTAAVLGIARWNHPAATSDQSSPSARGQLSASLPAKDDAGFVALPRSAKNARMAEGALAGKVAERPLEAQVEDAEQPRPGEATYRMDNLPKACGTYWVEDSDGGFSKIAVCNPDNHPGGSHE